MRSGKSVDASHQTEPEEPARVEQEAGEPTPASKQSAISRRRFIASSTGAAAALLATSGAAIAGQKSGAGQAGATGKEAHAAKPVHHAAKATFEEFSEPPAIYARETPEGSVLAGRLEAQLTNWTYRCGTNPPVTINVPIYNQHVPGPTLVIDPGTKIQLDLINNLPVKSPFSGDNCPEGMNGNPPNPECFTHTNLHTHGLLVSPCSVAKDGSTHCGKAAPDELRCSSDDVLVDIPPQGRNSYCIDVPSFHDAGTYWYHSHLHGATAYQVSSGMAGALIIREPYGQELVQPDREKIFLMQEVINQGTGQYPAVYGNGSRPGTTFFINGLCMPTLHMETGQTLRWRFINATATPQGLMTLRLNKCSSDPRATCDTSVPPWGNNTPMNLIAVDGISFYGFPPQPVLGHLIAPGNRADFLMNFREPGVYKLIKDTYPQDTVTLNSPDIVPATRNSKQVLAFIVVFPSSHSERLPDVIPGRRPFYLEPIGSVDRVRPEPVKFENPGAGEFQIDGNYYGRNAPLVAPLNTAEEWTLQNIAAGRKIPHPFHIHVNPFQVIGRTIDFETANPKLDPKNPCNWMWMDVVAIPAPANPAIGELKLRTRFLVYNGEFVVHCHILVHEDIGMMVNVKINGNGVPPNVPLREPTREAIACVERTRARC